MLSHLLPELLHMLHAHPLVFAVVSRDHYSVGYSPDLVAQHSKVAPVSVPAVSNASGED